MFVIDKKNQNMKVCKQECKKKLVKNSQNSL